MDNLHTGSTYTSSEDTVTSFTQKSPMTVGEICINDVTCDVSSVCEPMVWFLMFLVLANFEQILN
jgi:hypothetical protein